MTAFRIAGLIAAVLIYVGPLAAQDQSPTETKPALQYVQGDIVYGDANAPVEVIEYASMTCPHCAHFYDEVYKELAKELIPSGKVRLVFRNFVRDRADMVISVLSRCTTSVEETKKLIEVYFDQQESWMKSKQLGIALQSIANNNGVSFERIEACTKSNEIVEHVVEMRRVGEATYDIKATPTIILNGQKVTAKSFEEILAKIQLATLGR